MATTTDEAHVSSTERGALAEFIARSSVVEPDSIGMLADLAGEVLGARSSRLFIADYALRRVRELRVDGGAGIEIVLEGTVAGRAFASGVVVQHGERPVTVWIPVTEGTERIGLLELTFDEMSSRQAASSELADVVTAMMLMIVSRRRYTDVVLRARRALPMSGAAEAQWDLLPPLSYSGPDVRVSGILEPAYSIGGDSFDYAVNPGRLDFAIVDAVGHGSSAVLMASTAINSLRNARRENHTLDEAYRLVDRSIAEQFGHSFFVTGQLATFDTSSGRLTWLNAGHVLPLLVRNGSLVGELRCAPSMPMGLGGPVVAIAVEQLQPGDRVLFHTDGVSESRSADDDVFGTDRLADFLVRATLDGVSAAETVRRLSSNVVTYVGVGLRDDATMFLLEYLDHASADE